MRVLKGSQPVGENLHSCQPEIGAHYCLSVCLRRLAAVKCMRLAGDLHMKREKETLFLFLFAMMN